MQRGRQRPFARHALQKRNNRSNAIRVSIISAIGTLSTPLMSYNQRPFFLISKRPFHNE